MHPSVYRERSRASKEKLLARASPFLKVSIESRPRKQPPCLWQRDQLGESLVVAVRLARSAVGVALYFLLRGGGRFDDALLEHAIGLFRSDLPPAARDPETPALRVARGSFSPQPCTLVLLKALLRLPVNQGPGWATCQFRQFP
jgi:hypothetical protein